MKASKMMTHVRITLTILIFVMPAATAETLDYDWIEEVVASHFPRDLLDDWKSSRPAPRHHAFEIGAYIHEREKLILAVYTTGKLMQMRLIDLQGNVVYDPSPDIPPLRGHRPWEASWIESRDLDNDGVLEIILTTKGGFSRFAPLRSWVYRWNDGRFDVISPHLGEESALDYAVVHDIDVDGDGHLDIIAGAAGEAERNWYFSLHGSKLVPVAERVSVGRVTSRDGETRSEQWSFDVSEPKNPYLAVFLNGDNGGDATSTEVSFSVNGKEVLQPGDIDASVQVLHREVYLRTENKVVLSARGGRISFLEVFIVSRDVADFYSITSK